MRIGYVNPVSCNTYISLESKQKEKSEIKLFSQKNGETEH